MSRRLPIWQLYERARALGLAVQVSAQSWHGLGASEDERRRITASAEGGIWLLRTPEPIAAFAGTRSVVDTTRRLVRFPFWGHAGSSRLADRPVVDVALIRALDVGQAAYIYRGGVTYVQVKRLVGAPAAVGRPAVHEHVPADTAGGEAAGRAQARGPAAELAGRADLAAGRLPDVSTLLDAAFGQERPT